MPAPAWTRGSWGAGSTPCQDQQPVQGAQEYTSVEQPFPWITSKLPLYFCCFKYVLAACIRCPPFLGLGATKLLLRQTSSCGDLYFQIFLLSNPFPKQEALCRLIPYGGQLPASQLQSYQSQQQQLPNLCLSGQRARPACILRL